MKKYTFNLNCCFFVWKQNYSLIYIHTETFELEHNKNFKITCALGEDSDQPEQMCSLIRVFTVHSGWSLGSYASSCGHAKSSLYACDFVGFVMLLLISYILSEVVYVMTSGGQIFRLLIRIASPINTHIDGELKKIVLWLSSYTQIICFSAHIPHLWYITVMYCSKFWFDFCFTALQHILGHFGRGQLP